MTKYFRNSLYIDQLRQELVRNSSEIDMIGHFLTSFWQIPDLIGHFLTNLWNSSSFSDQFLTYFVRIWREMIPNWRQKLVKISSEKDVILRQTWPFRQNPTSIWRQNASENDVKWTLERRHLRRRLTKSACFQFMDTKREIVKTIKLSHEALGVTENYKIYYIYPFCTRTLGIRNRATSYAPSLNTPLLLHRRL